MYRKIFTFLVLLASINIAQTLNVIKSVKLISGDMERLYFPKFSPDGNYITISKSNFKGLWIYDLSQNKLIQINDYYGSGYQPRFSENGDINFFIDEYKNMRRNSVAKYYNLAEETEIDDTLNMRRQMEVKGGNSGIVLTIKNKDKIIKPIGEGNYIWVSLSPDKEKILFTLLGSGTYICDLDGRIISELGYANAPKWSPDGKWIAYMVDKDDGLNYISSDIIIASSDGKIKFNLTNTINEIEMYPEWSPDGGKIIFHNLNGEIILTEFEIK